VYSFIKTSEMIKLKLSLEISLSKVILGVAGVTATVCAFQYFKLKHKKSGTFAKSVSKFCDCKENENEAQRNKESIKQKCDANSMRFRSTNDGVKREENVSKEHFHMKRKSNASRMSRLTSEAEFFSPVSSNLSDKKADLSTDDLFNASEVNVNIQTQVVENNDEVVKTNKTTETGTQTSHSPEFTENNNKQETKNVDSSTQTDGNETSVNFNQVGSATSSVMNRSAADSDETSTDLGILGEETKCIDKIFKEKELGLKF